MSDEAQNEGPIIPEEDFREAIAACRQDPELDRYFKMAPKGARLFIGLGFYSTHFAEKTDKEQYQACLAEIEPSLMPQDLKYLIRFERDAKTKQYLRDLLKRREEEAKSAAVTSTPPGSPPPASKPAAPEPIAKTDASASVAKAETRQIKPIVLKPAKPAEPRQSSVVLKPVASRFPEPSSPLQRTLSDGLRLIADEEPVETPRSSVPFIAAIAIMAVIGCLVFVHLFVKTNNAYKMKCAYIQHLEQQIKVLQSDLARERAERAKNPAPAPVVPTESVPAPTLVATESAPEAPTVETPQEENAEPEVVETVSNAVAEVASAVKKGVRVVLTDGSRIVHRSNGKLIEVPRVFSYTGAGLKKPFWLYDKKMGDAKMEVEAQSEKQARAAWKVLYDEAVRQEDKQKK